MHTLSRTISLVSILAGTLLVVSAGGVSAKNDGNKGHRVDSQRMDTPSRISDRGIDARSSRAATRGANKKGFCPPGQAKKAGRGSAFNC